MDETIHPSAPEDQHVPLRWRNPLPSVALVAESITVASLIERKQLFKVDPQQPARDAADRLGRFDFDAAPQLDSYRPGCPPKVRHRLAPRVPRNAGSRAHRTPSADGSTPHAKSAIPDDSQLRPVVSHRMLVVLTADQRGAAVLIAKKPT
jgi:hypothetical protein